MQPNEIIEIYQNGVARIREIKDFTSKVTGEDPETGSVSWDVDYETTLQKTYAELSRVVKKFQQHVNDHPEVKEFQELYAISKNLKNRLSRAMNNLHSKLKENSEIKEESATAMGGASFSPGNGMAHYSKVPKKIKGSGLEVKKLYEVSTEEFQQERIKSFDMIEKGLNDLLPLISNAKNETINFYNANPGSYEIFISTDEIIDNINQISQILKRGEDENPE